MRLWLIHTQPLHEPAVLLGSQRSGFPFRPGPLERTRFQPLVKQHKSVAFPVQRLDSVPPSAAEQEQGVGEGIQVKLLLHHGGQPVNAPPQVGVAAGNVDLVRSREIAQHDFRIRSTVSTVAASAPGWISATAPAMRTVTATFPEQTGGVTSAKAVLYTVCCSDRV